ncbi:CdaR family transcriptional regulator [Virgibacillus ainsalahensis]
MDILTEKIATEIVHETSARLHSNVNIMNRNGVIIATQDTSRIGSIHEGAVEVLQTGETLIIQVNEKKTWGGTQPGVNLPIIFQDQIIGVIGITGDPDEMENIGELVKMTTELMIKQEFMASQLEWKQRTKEMIIEQLLKTDPSVTSIDRGMSSLGAKLAPPFTTIIIQLTERKILNQTFIQKMEEAVGKEHSIVGFINVNRVFIAIHSLEEKEIDQKIAYVYKALKKMNAVFRMAYSLPFYTLKKFSQSYRDCEITLKISDPSKELVSFAQIEVKALIYQVDEAITERFARRVLRSFDENKKLSLTAFFTNNLNIQKAAESLFVHRNTLIYRLNKITEETGYDPRNFRDALILQMAIWGFERGSA